MNKEEEQLLKDEVEKCKSCIEYLKGKCNNCGDCESDECEHCAPLYCPAAAERACNERWF